MIGSRRTLFLDNNSLLLGDLLIKRLREFGFKGAGDFGFFTDLLIVNFLCMLMIFIFMAKTRWNLKFEYLRFRQILIFQFWDMTSLSFSSWSIRRTLRRINFDYHSFFISHFFFIEYSIIIPQKFSLYKFIVIAQRILNLHFAFLGDFINLIVVINVRK